MLFNYQLKKRAVVLWIFSKCIFKMQSDVSLAGKEGKIE